MKKVKCKKYYNIIHMFMFKYFVEELYLTIYLLLKRFKILTITNVI